MIGSSSLSFLNKRTTREEDDPGSIGPWLADQIKRWEEEKPTDDQDGDSEATKRARVDLRAYMRQCGWDIYGGSSKPTIVAMNYAWEEGFLEAREQSYKKEAREEVSEQPRDQPKEGEGDEREDLWDALGSDHGDEDNKPV